RRLEERHASGLEHIRTDLRRSFHAVERKLRKGLAVYRQAMDAGPAASADSFAAVAGGVLREQAGELDRLLRAVRAPEDEEAHLARIAAKRLRYLLEPLRPAIPAGTALLVRLQSLQDRLGDLHDTIELAHQVRAAAEAAAAERAARVMEVALTDQSGPAQLRAVRGAEPRSGLIAVARRLSGRLTAQFAALQTSDLGHDAAWLREIDAVLGRSGPAAPNRIPVPVPPARRHRQRRV
ncbi:MAG TPA: CHAD domain-containing protein, partial [Gemmatimonadales bacterium]